MLYTMLSVPFDKLKAQQNTENGVNGRNNRNDGNNRRDGNKGKNGNQREGVNNIKLGAGGFGHAGAEDVPLLNMEEQDDMALLIDVVDTEERHADNNQQGKIQGNRATVHY